MRGNPVAMAYKVVYFEVGGKPEQAEFSSDDNSEDLRELFRAAAEANPNDVLKLYNGRGSLLNICPSLPANTPDTRYRLEVVAAQCNGKPNIVSQLGYDITALEERLQALERRVFLEIGEVPPAVREMTERVEQFRLKLEGMEHLSWLGLFKDISSSSMPFWDKQRSSNIHVSQDHCSRVQQNFKKLSQAQITDNVREYLKKPVFDNWQWDEAEMMVLLRQMYLDLDLIEKFKIPMETLEAWLFEIYKHYNLVPFHNFKHCFMVAQMMYGLIWLTNLQEHVDDLDILLLLTSAISHDLDHPGYNNAYQINAKTELALRYNDISPLENHHCAVAFDILRKPECNIFVSLTRDQYRYIREGMIKCILATDMAKHNEILNSFKNYLPNFDFKNKEHKSMLTMILMKVSDISNEARPLDVASQWVDCLLMEFFNQLLMILVKAADISNEVRPISVAEPWLECLLQEFFVQSDLEKLEGLPVAPFMDRDKVTKPSSQIGFIKFVLLPLFEALGQLFPKIEPEIIDPVRFALNYYTDMQVALEEEKKKKMEGATKSNGPTAEPGPSSDKARTPSPVASTKPSHCPSPSPSQTSSPSPSGSKKVKE